MAQAESGSGSGYRFAGEGVDGSEFGADLVSVGMVEFVEDGPGSLPGLASGLGIADGVMGVAEASAGSGFASVVEAAQPDVGETENTVGGGHTE